MGGCSCVTSGITRVLKRGRQEGQRESLEDATRLALKMEEGATVRGMQVASRRWKRPGNGLSP